MVESRLFCVVAALLALGGGTGAAEDRTGGGDRTGVEELRRDWQLGTLRGSVRLRISDEEGPQFRAFMDEFAREHSFTNISAPNRRVLSGREFLLEWYRRRDGVTILVTNITLPEKMQVAFYDREGGIGTAEAERALLDFKSLSSRFRDYE